MVIETSKARRFASAGKMAFIHPFVISVPQTSHPFVPMAEGSSRYAISVSCAGSGTAPLHAGAMALTIALSRVLKARTSAGAATSGNHVMVQNARPPSASRVVGRHVPRAPRASSHAASSPETNHTSAVASSQTGAPASRPVASSSPSSRCVELAGDVPSAGAQAAAAIARSATIPTRDGWREGRFIEDPLDGSIRKVSGNRIYANAEPLLTRPASIARASRVLSALVHLTLVSGLGLGCSRTGTSSAPPPEAGPLPVHDAPFAGCAAVVREGRADGGVVCELAPPGSVRVALPDGLRSIDVAPGTKRIDIDVLASGGPARFTLAMKAPERRAWLDEARALRTSGDMAHARAVLEPHLQAPDPTERAFAEGMLARILLAEGRGGEAFPRFRRAIELHRAAGRVSDAADDSFALAFGLDQRSHRYDEARAVLDAAATDIALYPEGRAREPYYRGLLASETGDERTALGLLREAERRAAELGMVKLARNARASAALVLEGLGRVAEALTIAREIDREANVDGSPCERAESANNVGWLALLAGEDAKPALERAIQAEGCTDAYVRSTAFANRARLALREGDPAAATSSLAQARMVVSEPRGVERIDNLEIEGRIALARGEPTRALRAFDAALALARAAVLPLLEWKVLVARGAALEALGRAEAAARAFVEAEAVLDDAALLAPLGEGRAAFVADRAESAKTAVELLARMHRAEQVARVARRSRARVLAGIERSLRISTLSEADRVRWEKAVHEFRRARADLDAAAANDWKLSEAALKEAVLQRRSQEDALRTALEQALALLPRSRPSTGDPELAPGDLELVIHPTRRGWIAVARDVTSSIVRVAPPPTATADELSRFLGSFASSIVRARRLRVHAYGAWRGVDVHALSFSGEPLVARVAVDYPIGLAAPGAPAASDASASGARWLVVGDPTGDLPNASSEARAVSASLREGSHDTVTLLVRDDATSARVSEALRGSRGLHYAGHGLYAGREGWESALPLAGGGRLTIPDILSLSPAPERVVLTGCDAARSEGDAEGLGIAQAFVVAGAAEALAPVRPVSDVLAARLAGQLRPEEGRLSDAWRRAVLRLRADDPSVDWAAFRVVAR